MSIAYVIERLEMASGPDRDLDELIAAALFPEHEFMQLKDAPEGVGCMMYRWPDGQQVSALRATSSIDAAVKLYELVLPRHDLFIENYGGEWFSSIKDRFEKKTYMSRANCKNGAIATCQAILSALQAKGEAR